MLLLQIELAGMRGEPKVELDLGHRIEREGIIIHDGGVARHPRKFGLIQDAWDIGDQDTIGPAFVLHREQEAAGALGMAGMVQQDDVHAAELYRIAVVEQAVGFDRFEDGAPPAKYEVRVAAILENRRVFCVDHDPGFRVSFDSGHRAYMVKMGLVGKQDPDIGEFEAKLPDMPPERSVRAANACINENIAFRRGNEIAGQVIAANIIEVADNTKRGVFPDPVGLEVGDCCQGLGGGMADRSGNEDNGEKAGYFDHRFELKNKGTKRIFT